MNRLKSLIAILVLTACGSGCAHKQTTEELRAKSEQAAAAGVAQFHEELVQKNVRWYVAGGQTSGFNADTGLPEVAVSSLPPDMQNTEFVTAHNAALQDYIKINGSVPGTFLPWEYNLFHQSAYWAAHSGQQPDTLRPGSSVSAPGGQYTLKLQPAGLVVETDSGGSPAATPPGANASAVDVLFGPSGSDVAYTRWPTGGEPVYAAMNLRDGKWLVVQRGGQ